MCNRHLKVSAFKLELLNPPPKPPPATVFPSSANSKSVLPTSWPKGYLSSQKESEKANKKKVSIKVILNFAKENLGHAVVKDLFIQFLRLQKTGEI